MTTTVTPLTTQKVAAVLSKSFTRSKVLATRIETRSAGFTVDLGLTEAGYKSKYSGKVVVSYRHRTFTSMNEAERNEKTAAQLDLMESHLISNGYKVTRNQHNQLIVEVN